jgi:hypothetical protein
MNVKKLTISTGTSDALTTKQAGFIVSVLSILRPVYVCIDDNCRGHRGAIDRIAFEASRDASVSHLKFHAASLHLRKIIDGLDARENIPLVSLSIGYTDNNLRGLLFHPHCEYLHELSLGFVNFENMVDIGQYLRYTLAPLLKRLKIWRCWAIDAAPIIEAFEEGAAPLLESITISGPSLEGNLGVRLANGLRGKPLREIRIFHCHMDTQAMTHLLNTLSSFPRLKKLDVQNTYMKRMNDITLSHDGLVAGLESVVLRHHNLGQGAGTFMKMMVNSPCKDTLLHLDLSDCHLDDAAFVEIGKQIHKLRSLQTIDLSGNCIGDMGIHFLSSGLERHTGIAKVMLRRVGLRRRGLLCLCRYMKGRACTRRVYIFVGMVPDHHNLHLDNDNARNFHVFLC